MSSVSESNAAARRARLGMLFVVVAAVLWGTGNPVAGSMYSVAQTTPQSIAFFRMALSIPALLAGCGLLLRGRMFDVRRADWVLILIAGALVGSYQALFYASLPRIGVAIASVVSLASAPIIVALITAVQTRRRPSLPVTLALAFAIAGIVLIGNVSQDGQRPDVVGGALLAFLAGAVYAVNTLVGRRLGREGRVYPAQTAAFGFAFGALILLVFALTTGGLVIRYPAEGWLRLAYLGLFLTALGYGLLYAGMRWTSATAASIATLMEPVTSTVIAVVVFREPLGWSALLGIALLLASIIVLVLDREER